MAENPSNPVETFRPLFEPRVVAIAGASAKGLSAGNRYIRHLRDSGYAGAVYPIHPTASEIEGLPAYRSLTETPEPVDYAYLTVPAAQVVPLLEGARGRLKFAQVMASAEHDANGPWERALAETAARGDFRLIGPNCMGTHSPRGRVTFMEGALMEEGDVGIASQSGGLGMDILRRGQSVGLRFSGLVTLGNSIDVQPADLLEHYLADPRTSVVGLYVEDVKDGKRFRALAQANTGRKPIVVLLGGTTSLGRQAAASHTGALGGTGRAWEALARETGIILTRTLDSFLEALLVCRFLRAKPLEGEPSLTLFGNGGGTSVLATDCIARAGFSLAQMTEEARAEFAALELPPGASLANPIDLPASVLRQEQGRVSARILDIARRRTRPYAVIAHLNLPVILGYRHVPNLMPNLIDALLSSATGPDAPHVLLAIRSDGSEEVEDWKRQFRAAAASRNVPAFDEIPQCVDALAAFCAYEKFLARRAGEAPLNAPLRRTA